MFRYLSKVYYTFLLTVLLSCSESLIDDMMRVAEDPEVNLPVVASFKTESTISISWDEDEAAEEYLLYRAQDAVSPVYQKIYEGEDLDYTDTDLSDDTCYLYRLGKRRGTEIFGPSEAVLGVGSPTVMDSLEYNNRKIDATELIWDLNANIYYYLSYGGAEITDYDWYKLTVPPRRLANIVVNQGDGTNLEESDLIFAQEGHVPEIIINNEAIEIENTSYSEATFYFLIYPNEDYFIEDPTMHGGKIINYSISLSSIMSL